MSYFRISPPGLTILPDQTVQQENGRQPRTVLLRSQPALGVQKAIGTDWVLPHGNNLGLRDM